jgi:hypothetical protein
MHDYRTDLPGGRVGHYTQLAPDSVTSDDATVALHLTAGYGGPVHLYVEAANDVQAAAALRAGAQLADQLGLVPAAQASAAR